ncbi:MAG: cytochrome b N-terminal domain-containing protein [Ignavibacteriaceae bacterium]
MSKKVWNWINERIPLSSILRMGMDEEIPGGSRFSYALGSATLLVFLIQLFTGVLELFYYAPTVDHAYDSINYLRVEVPFGWLIHGLHYWGATAMIVIVSLHMLRVFIWGAYKNPRQLTWILGVILFLLALGMSFTGAALPWDQRGYWAAQVGTNIGGTVPFIGNFLKLVIRGGSSMGQLTLSRFFILHVAVIPGIIVMFIIFHLVAFRKHGSVGPWEEEKRNVIGQFWPDQIFKDVVVAIIILLALIALSTYSPPPFSGPADPMDSSYIPKPEWNFLFLYQALKFFPGSLEIIGTVGIPTILVLLLLFLPFIDKNKIRNPLKRIIVVPAGLLIVASVIILTIAGYNSGINTVPDKPNVAKTAVHKENFSSNDIRLGKQLFTSLGCVGCHTVMGTGGTVGPDLSNEIQKGRTKEWLIAQIQNSKSHNPTSIMPAFSFLKVDQLNQLVAFLMTPSNMGSGLTAQSSNTPISNSNSINTSNADTANQVKTDSANMKSAGLAASILGSAEHGKVLFDKNCVSCHGKNGKGKVPNPGSESGVVPALNPISEILYNKDPEKFSKNIDLIIQHGSIPKGGNPALKMEAFGDQQALSQQQISDIEAYILSLNGIERGMIKEPGMNPVSFFILSIGLFAGLGIVFLIAWTVKKKK